MRTLLATIGLCLLPVEIGHAQPGSLSDLVGFDEALALAADGPSVSGLRRTLAHREHNDGDIGGTAQSTSVTVMPGAVLVPDQERGFELQVSVGQGWNLADLGGARRRAAADEREVLSAEARAAALRARLAAARRWIDLWTLSALDQLLRAEREVARDRVRRAERALETGVGRRADVAEARATLVELEQRGLALEGDAFLAAGQLAVAMGGAAGDRPRVFGPLPHPRLPTASRARALFERLDDLPEVAVQRLSVVAARARETEASAQYAPVFSLGAQVERSSGDAWVLYGIASLSFNAFGQERRAVSEASTDTDRAETSLEVARLGARVDLEQALHEVEHARRERRVFETALLPALAELEAHRERALNAGEETIFGLLDARARHLAAREGLTRAQGAVAWAEIHLWLLLAELLQGGAS